MLEFKFFVLMEKNAREVYQGKIRLKECFIVSSSLIKQKVLLMIVLLKSALLPLFFALPLKLSFPSQKDNRLIDCFSSI